MQVITKIGNTKNAKYFFTKEGKKEYLNELETALYKENDLGIDLGIPPQIIPKSQNDLGIPEGQYLNEYPNPNPRPTRVSGGLEYSIPLNAPKNFGEQENVTNSPPGENLPPEFRGNLNCPACNHPRREEIEYLFDCGVTPERLSKKYGVSISAIYGHMKFCVMRKTP